MSLLDDIKARELPSESYKLAKKDTTLAQAAYSAATMALRRLESKGEKKSTAAYKRAAKSVDETQQALDACYIELIVRALPADEYDALIDKHPPTEAQEAKAKEKSEEIVWNEDTFKPALLSASVDGDMSADDWSAALKKMTKAESRELWVMCLTLNEMSRQPDLDSVGKGLGALQSMRWS